jgi:hypothetical protein
VSRSLTLAIVLYGLALAGWAIAAAVSGRPRPHTHTASLVVLELALVGQAVLDLVTPANRHHPAEPATHIGYLLASVVLLPAFAAYLYGDRGRWASATLAVACVTLCVVSIRLQATHA